MSQTGANKREPMTSGARWYIFRESFVMITIVEAYADPSLFEYHW